MFVQLMTFEGCTQMIAEITNMTKKKIESTTKLACLVFYFLGACLCKVENLAKDISTQLTEKYSEKYNLLTIFIV